MKMSFAVSRSILFIPLLCLVTPACSSADAPDGSPEAAHALRTVRPLRSPTASDFTYFKAELPHPGTRVPTPRGVPASTSLVDPCVLYGHYATESCGQLHPHAALSEDGGTLALAGSNGKVGVGALCDEATANFVHGGVYVYTRRGGVWSLEEFLVPPMRACHDAEAASLALSRDGHTLVLGMGQSQAPVYMRSKMIDTRQMGPFGLGRVVVYERVANRWNLSAQIEAPARVTGKLFGAKVALSADGRVLVATAEDRSLGKIVYTFDRRGSTWERSVKTVPGSLPVLNEDGSILAAALSSNEGRPTEDEQVFVYRRDPGGDWQLKDTLRADPANDYRHGRDVDFGESISMDKTGSRLAIGTPGERPTPSLSHSGGAYVYVRGGEHWSKEAHVDAPPAVGELHTAEFGSAVTLSADGQFLAIGSPQEENTGMKPGKVRIYQWQSGTWTMGPNIGSPHPDKTTFYGSFLMFAENGSQLLVGASLDSSRASGIQGDPTPTTGNFTVGSFVVARTR